MNLDFEKIFESEERKHIKAHFENMIDLAKADGNISEEERAHLAKMARRFNLTDEQFEKMLTEENQYSFKPPISKEERYMRFVNLVKLTVTDEIIDPHEIRTLERFAAGLGFESKHVEHFIDGIIGALSEGYDADEIIEMMDGFAKVD